MNTWAVAAPNTPQDLINEENEAEAMTGLAPRRGRPTAEVAWEHDNPLGKVSLSAPGEPTRVVLWNFTVDGYAIKPGHVVMLNEVARAIRRSLTARPGSELTVTVEGHTSTSGSPDHNRQLAARRAQSVADYLRAQRLPIRVVSRSFGPAKPLATNRTPEEMAMNRRVEILGAWRR